jgi:predicted RND superfamily exporter protein
MPFDGDLSGCRRGLDAQAPRYGLQFSGVIALTVSFGLGLSATIHFLNRMTQERKPDEDPAVAVERATILVGPALILTTFVLACGLAALVLSDLPALRLFGWLSALAMLAALVADLLILRPVITFLLRSARRAKPLEMTAVVQSSL